MRCSYYDSARSVAVSKFLNSCTFAAGGAAARPEKKFNARAGGLERVRLLAAYRKRFPHQLSGGERWSQISATNRFHRLSFSFPGQPSITRHW